MTITDIELPPEDLTMEQEVMLLVDTALADFSHLSLVDATAVSDVLLDIRKVVGHG